MKAWRDINAIYQVYPRSFKDTNGDGVGDLKGITEKLDYLADSLGVEAIWLSPFYPSPQADCGYDVSDYVGVDPLFGNIGDFDELLLAAHEKGLRIMLDLVPNHTSDQHQWFKESRTSRVSAKRDWYVWRDQPNNWRSISGGSSWEKDEASGQYYLHSFLPSQPDLNWENPAVREAIKEVMRFWFQKGVDGFRVDAVWPLSKDTSFADDPVNPAYSRSDEYGGYLHSACKDGPRLEEFLEEIASVAREFEDKKIIFEYYPDSALGDSLAQIARIQGVSPAISSPFYFEGIHFPWHAEQFGVSLQSYLAIVPEGTRPTFCFSNHDQPRLVSRYGEERARLIAFLQMTLPGLPVFYYGDEIGMKNGSIPTELTEDKFEKTGDSGGRDPERTPMQWDGSLRAGFTDGTPWLPIGDEAINKNVDSEQGEIGSWFVLYQRLMELRRDQTIQRGSFTVVPAGSGYVLAYERSLNNVSYYVLCNFADVAQVTELPKLVGDIVAETLPGVATIRSDGRVSVAGFGAVLLRVVSD